MDKKEVNNNETCCKESNTCCNSSAKASDSIVAEAQESLRRIVAFIGSH
jgi:hypothetical protein